jgi:NADH-quinone oxidoreductase subunit E
MSPVDGAGASNPNLPVDVALTAGRVPDRASEGVPELHEVGCPPELRDRIELLMSRYPDRHSASIPALWAVQERYGWCTPGGIRQAAAVMRVTPGYLESVASFYDLLHTERVGSHRIEVCTNISCWMRGGDELLDAFKAAAEGDDDLFVTGFECLGACDIAPMASIDQRYYGPLEAAEAGKAISQIKAGEDVLPDKNLAKRPLAGDTPSPVGRNATPSVGNRPTDQEVQGA